MRQTVQRERVSELADLKELIDEIESKEAYWW
jgi:hypothetical protein